MPGQAYSPPIPATQQDSTMSFSKRNNVKIFDSGKRAMVLADGLGCDRTQWREREPLSP
ncbi:hypothetical protein B0G76_5214 [Paraburkholderia sp. BL23I1N1]|nr:hypothetical protein B0G76_5214 [Paraburkholderia sp. BL23I1N1]